MLLMNLCAEPSQSQQPATQVAPTAPATQPRAEVPLDPTVPVNLSPDSQPPIGYLSQDPLSPIGSPIRREGAQWDLQNPIPPLPPSAQSQQ